MPTYSKSKPSKPYSCTKFTALVTKAVREATVLAILENFVAPNEPPPTEISTLSPGFCSFNATNLAILSE